ncbi:probable LRR receptor-like serine/threonine-protein kinase At1g56130 isoform X2 [Ziziphus jujuba]|uniref:non-specific serine/threonine protein kinase n=1 Tax=Ziziphus jujuba TaxID=326968 RepID=A0ABM4A8A7_ZIZJJ|nr:probable LRR receptor-like serine/threonine-protein kinase At1g56130 isoform X2 [Ziziphus jujuba]
MFACVTFAAYWAMGVWSFSLLLLCAFQLGFAQPTTDPNEVAALKKIIDYWNLGKYLNISIDPCNQNATWASDTANPRIACDCGENTCYITHLKVYALDIYGELPKELFELKKMKDLNLGQNVLSGTIPAEIGQLSDMEYLSLGINNLTGLVPLELGNLTKLISLSFSSNNFFGPLPLVLGKLASLEQLYIDSSGVTGPIPQELANLKLLRILWASDNLFTGELPEFLGTLTELIDLRLEGTSLEGPIPSSFGALTKLETLRLGGLSEEDSSLDFLENQTSLAILSLRNCRLSDEIPERIGRFAKLQHLYLGNNNLNGEIPANIITPKLIALDVSFNHISGNFPPNSVKAGFSMNVVGTSISANSLPDRKAFGLLNCLQGDIKCTNHESASLFSVKCGGKEQITASNIKYDDDSEILGAASLYTNSKYQWAVSNTGNFLFNPNGPQYTARTDSQITETLDSELYKTARISPGSLRYFGFDLKNGKYVVKLHFAEITMDDTRSWKGLGRRIFDVYIQGERVLQDFNIQKEAGGSKRALIKTFEANVTNTIIDIHFLWAGKGTCCIPFQGTYGPLVSAINVYQVSGVGYSSGKEKKHVGKIVGIALGCVAGFGIILSVFYLWFRKEPTGHLLVHTDSPKK